MRTCTRCGSGPVSGPWFLRGLGCRCHPDAYRFRCLGCGHSWVEHLDRCPRPKKGQI